MGRKEKLNEKKVEARRRLTAGEVPHDLAPFVWCQPSDNRPTTLGRAGSQPVGRVGAEGVSRLFIIGCTHRSTKKHR